MNATASASPFNFLIPQFFQLDFAIRLAGGRVY